MARMTDSELRKQVETMLVKSDWYDNAEVQANMRAAIDSYLGRRQKPSIPGLIDFQSEDVADMVEAVTAQIMPAFHFDEIAQFQPNGPGDVSQARLESKVVNQFIFDFNEGDTELQTAVRDALLLRNGIIKIYPEQEVSVTRERYVGLNPLELAQVQEPTSPDQEINVTMIRANDEDTDLTDINLTRTSRFRRLAIESTDPVNFIIQREYTQVDPIDALVVGERRYETRGDLLAQGFDPKVVESLPATETDTREASLARNRTRTTPFFDYGSKALEHIEVFELYVKVDYDGDGIAERRRILYAGGTSGGVVIENEPHNLVPYAVGVPFLYPHRFQGISLYDKLAELMKQKSKALTQYAQNIEANNFNELVVADGEVAEADYTTRRAGGTIRADRTDSVRQLSPGNIGAESLAFLGYLDKVRSERGGASLDLQAAEAQIASDSAHGVERMYSTREQIATMICNTIGDTLVKQLFRLVHRSLKEYFTGPQNFHIGADLFTTADTAAWPARYKVRVTAGMSNAERQQKRAVLESHILQQEKLWQAGMDGVLVDFTTYHNALLDWSKTGGLQTPSRYWLDPQSDDSQAALQQKAQAAEQQRVRDEALQMALLELQVSINQNDNQTDIFKHLTELRQKYWQGVLNSEMEELRTQAQGAPDASPDPEQIDEDQETGRERAGEVVIQ